MKKSGWFHPAPPYRKQTNTGHVSELPVSCIHLSFCFCRSPCINNHKKKNEAKNVLRRNLKNAPKKISPLCASTWRSHVASPSWAVTSALQGTPTPTRHSFHDHPQPQGDTLPARVTSETWTSVSEGVPFTPPSRGGGGSEAEES